MTITHLFFDIGGVLGSNGWDQEQRVTAARHFGLSAADLEELHSESIAMLEQGRMSLDEYLSGTVFSQPRSFDPAEFKAYMFSLSVPDTGTIELARALSRTGRYQLMTINNELAELNEHRLQHFGLPGIFSAFFSSCWVGVLKPALRIYQLALAMSQAAPGESVFIDDRERNLDPARSLGMKTIHYTDALRLKQELAELGVHT